MASRSHCIAAVLTSLALSARAADAAAWLAGSPTGWQPDGVPIVAQGGEQLLVSIHPDGSGGAFIFWRDNLPPDPRTNIYASHITGDGAFAPGWPAQGKPIFVGAPGLSVAPDRSGGFYLVWVDNARGDHLIAQRMSPDGTVQWAAGGVEVCPAGGKQAGSILVDDTGALVLVWLDDRYSPPPPPSPEKFDPINDIFAQKLDPSGLPMWDLAGLAVCTDSSDQSYPRVVTDGQGGAIVVWTDSRGWLDPDHLRMACIQRLDPAGAPLLARDGVGIGDIRGGWVVPDGAAGVIIASYDGRNGRDDDIYAQRVDAAGVRQWGVGGVPISTAIYDQRVNALISDGTGGALVAWHDLRNGQDWDIYAQRITSNGAVAPGWPVGGLPVCALPGNQIYPKIIPDGTGGCVVTWYDFRTPASEYDIYAQRLLGAAEIAPGWPAGGVALCTAASNQVYPAPVPDGTGGAIVAWTDYRVYADVYAQRVSGAGIVGKVATTGVDGPSTSRLQLEGFRPNPASRTLNVALSLPSSERATLELIDVSGRLLRRREVGSLGPGRHVLSLGPAPGLRSGIYLLRLTQAGRSAVTRGCLVR